MVAKSHSNVRITPHSFRRSFATYQHRIGTSDTDLMTLMGHNNIQTTQGYIIRDVKDLKRSANRLNEYHNNLSLLT